MRLPKLCHLQHQIGRLDTVSQCTDRNEIRAAERVVSHVVKGDSSRGFYLDDGYEASRHLGKAAERSRRLVVHKKTGSTGFGSHFHLSGCFHFDANLGHSPGACCLAYRAQLCPVAL